MWRGAAVLVALGATIGAAAVAAHVRLPAPRRRIVVTALAAATIVGVGATVWTRPSDRRACNGHVELCDRRYDDVTSAATHNSMSSPEVVQVWPEHDGGLTEQLDAGVHTLLIDTHNWPPVESAAQLAGSVASGESILPSALADALHRQVVTVRDGRPGAFLCHNHCASGAQPLVDGLDEVADFLRGNRTRSSPSPSRTPSRPTRPSRPPRPPGHVHPHDPDDEWPTLGALIDDGERLVVFAENEAPPPAWYVNAFDAVQDTPFLFLSAEDFSCVENRGDADSSLLLMNHWIQRVAPDRADAAPVNTLDVLVDRARQCERERGRRPNYLAVNFYNIGDVVEAADVLNGVAPAPLDPDG